MGDYVERTLEIIKRLQAQMNSESATTIDEYIGLNQSRRSFFELVETRRTLEHTPTTLEGHRAVYRELHRAMMQIETLVKEWCNLRHHHDERALGKRREHCRETLLAARWWTMVTASQAGHRYYFQTLPLEVDGLQYPFRSYGPYMERKGESQVTSQGRPISSYERQLPSIGFETWLQQFNRTLLRKVAYGSILGKDESSIDMALERIRGSDYRVVVIEDMPAIYVDEAKSPLIEEEVTLDLTRDVLGVSRTGAWVIRTKCQGVGCALKRIADGDREPVLARLSHPHIVQLMHYWRKDEYMFLVMELMEGDLTDLLSRHKRVNDTLLSVSVAVDIMLQTAKGMLYLHDLGIAHPHLSCSNVLFRESDVSQEGVMQYIIKLGGFRNCAWDASDGKKQDVYRFGLFCLEVLTGRQQCEDPLDMVADTRPSIPETIPQVLRFCISSCFESNVQLGFAQVVTLLLLAQVQELKSQENEIFLSFGTCEDLDLVQLNQQYSESPSASGADLEKYPVHQLHPEPDAAGSDFNPSATLIFFHGFAKSSDEWKSTWMTRNREHVWPKEWLPKDLPGNVRILSLSYDIDAPGESQDIGAIEIGKSALRQLVLSSKWKLTDPKAKVILIGHSFGGLVIKSLVVEAHNLAFIASKTKTEVSLVMKCPSFLENLEGIVFYSVPGSASQDQQFEKYIVKLNQTGVLQRSSLMQALLKDTRLFNKQMISLCSQFEEIVPEKTQILGFIEGKGMRRIREKQVVVSDASARAQMKKAEFNIVEEDNHFEVCRPVSAHHKGYKILVDFLRDKLKIGPLLDLLGSLNFGAKKGSAFRQFVQSRNVPTANQQDVPTSIPAKKGSAFRQFVQSRNVPTANQQDVPTSIPEDVPKKYPLGVPTRNQRLQPGFRFHPSDVELVAYYLMGKINGWPIEKDPIAEVDVYKCEPWDLPDKSLLGSNDQEWYFYSARDRKYPNGSRTNRATEIGYWKSTGKDRIVRSSRSSGFKKTLVYYRGRAPRGERTDWVMHEFRMEDKVYENLAGRQAPYILARVFKKGAAAPVLVEPYSSFLQSVEEEIRVQDEKTPVEPIFSEKSEWQSPAMGHLPDVDMDGFYDENGEWVARWIASFDVDIKSGGETSSMQETVDTVQGQPQQDLWMGDIPSGSNWHPLDPNQTQAKLEVKVEPKSEMALTGGGNNASDWPDQKTNILKMGSIDAKVDKQGQSNEVTRVFQRRKQIKEDSEGRKLQKSKAGAEAGDESPENKAKNSESPGRETMSPEIRAALAGALMEIFARHHVCCMEIIVQSLQEMAFKHTVAKTDSEAAAFAVAAAEALNAPVVELIGAVNKVATRLGGVYILTSLGDPMLDPFRDVVIGLLRKMGPHSGLRRTEIMNAFKIATGRDVPSTTYQKVMKELCYTRPAAWILKLGEG